MIHVLILRFPLNEVKSWKRLHNFMSDDSAAMEIFGVGYEIIEEFFVLVADTEHGYSSYTDMKNII